MDIFTHAYRQIFRSKTSQSLASSYGLLLNFLQNAKLAWQTSNVNDKHPLQIAVVLVTDITEGKTHFNFLCTVTIYKKTSILDEVRDFS